VGLLAMTACRSEPATSPGAADDGRRAAVLRFWSLIEDATRLRLAADFEAAATAYRRALELDPVHEDALYYLGYSMVELRRHGEARVAFLRLVECNPSSARGHLALGSLLASPDPDAPLDLEAAERHLRRAHEINAEETGPMVRLGEILAVRGRRDEARRWLEAAGRTNPRCVEAPLLLGYLAWEDGDRATAARQLRLAAEAARVQAPVKGVLGEGDRKAPPPRSALGPTLFGRASDALRAAGDAATVTVRPDQVYVLIRSTKRLVLERVKR
jgi:tetratricopeptide (TPR) repeat protein